MHTSTIISTLILATTAIAQDYGSGSYGSGSGSYGSGSGSGSGSYGSGSGSGGYGSGSGSGSGSWSSWGMDTSSAVPPAVAAPTQSAAPDMAPPAAPPAPPMTPPMMPPMGEQIVQVVSVSDANGSLKYFPDSVQAPVGSIVQFQFHPKNHTITESTFAQPCVPVSVANASLITTTRPGLKSGFVPVTPSDTETPVYNVLVNDTKPIWIYCGQTNHCEKGMAMVINQNLSTTDKTIQNYIMAAMQIPLVSVNTTAPPSGSPPPPPYGSAPPPPPPFGGSAPSSAPVAATSVVVAPPPPADTASAALPPPTGAPGSAATTTAAAAPATFTGAAGQQSVERTGLLAGLVVAGVAALL